MRLKAKLNVQFIINLMVDLLGHSKEKGHAGKIFQFSCSEVIFSQIFNLFSEFEADLKVGRQEVRR